MNVVITIPAYNEEKTLGKVLKEIKEVMRQTDYNYTILVLDDGSRDRTVKVAKKEGAYMPHKMRKLKGAPLQKAARELLAKSEKGELELTDDMYDLLSKRNFSDLSDDDLTHFWNQADNLATKNLFVAP